MPLRVSVRQSGFCGLTIDHKPDQKVDADEFESAEPRESIKKMSIDLSVKEFTLLLGEKFIIFSKQKARFTQAFYPKNLNYRISV